MSRLTRLLLSATFILPLVGHSASPLCAYGENITGCVNQMTEQIRLENKKGVARENTDLALEKLKSLPTGISLSELGSTVTDTMKVLSVLGLDNTDRNGRPDTAFAWAPRFFAEDGANIGTSLAELQLNREASLSPIASAALKEGGNGELIAQLEDELSEFDDVALSWLDVSDSGIFARDIHAYRSLLDELIFLSLTSARTRQSLFSLNARLVSREGALGACPNQLDAHTVITRDLSTDCIAAISEAAYSHASLSAERYRRQGSFLAANGIPYFANLVANNAQLSWGVAHHSREAIVGADLTALRASFEMGTPSLTWFLLKNADACKKNNGRYTSACAEKLAKYFKDNANNGVLNEGVRVKLAVEYAQLEADEIYIPLSDALLSPLLGNPISGPVTGLLNQSGLYNLRQDGIHLSLPEVERFTVNAGLGWMVSPPKGEGLLKRSTRLDAIAKYQTFSTNPIYSEAWSVALTLSFDVGGITIPVQLIHHGKSEFGAAGVKLDDTTLGIGMAYRLLN
ncbi:hypothetical protein [Zhongshania sp.]|uniref:hypothetical protein n=1 Tax=Zhongshania sp. TaxID=1971902 RepID=UPI0035646753